MIHAEHRIPLHDGILERTLEEVERERNAERDFWARIAAERAPARNRRLCTSRTRRRDRGEQAKASSGFVSGGTKTTRILQPGESHRGSHRGELDETSSAIEGEGRRFRQPAGSRPR